MWRLLTLCAAMVSMAMADKVLWEQYKEKYGLSFEDHEEANKLKTFKANLEYINGHNAEADLGKQTYWMGINQFTHMTKEEFRTKVIGNCLFDTNVTESTGGNVHKYKSKRSSGGVDWRDQGYVTEVKDQGQCGSCWAFAAVASMEAAHYEKYGSTVQMSEQQVVDCDTRSNGCNGGWYHTAWRYVSEEGGIETLADYPYHAREGTCKAGQNDFVSSVAGWEPERYGLTLVGDEEELQKMVNDRPVAVAVDATPFQFYSSGILDCRSFHSLNHAVFAVGYVDGSHWIVKNSWGTSWGESGYVRVGMGGNPCGIADYPMYSIAG